MEGTERQRNPFRPGAGVLPPVLAGRDAELSTIRSALGALGSGYPPSQGLLLVGPRGNGKTTLLLRVEDLARRRGFRVAQAPAHAFAGRRTLTDYLRARAGPIGSRLTDPFRLLASWIRAEAAPLVFVLDEVQAVEPSVGFDFFDAVQGLTGRRLPFLLAAAGTPDAARRLRACGGFTERMFRRVSVGRLEESEAVRALAEAARRAGRPFTERAARRLAEAAQNYPFFIQLFGKAAWEAAQSAEQAVIGMDCAVEAEARLASRLEFFYSQRYGEARRHGVRGVLLPLASRLRAHGGAGISDFTIYGIIDQIADPTRRATEPGALLGTLSDLGIVWRAPGGWEPGIPGFIDYVLGLPREQPGE